DAERPPDRLPRLRRVGRRAVDEPAAPDVAPRARQRGAVPRVARPAPAAPGGPRPAPDGEPGAARRGGRARRRRPARAVAAGHPAARPAAPAQPERAPAPGPGRPGRALARLRATDPVELRA